MSLTRRSALGVLVAAAASPAVAARRFFGPGGPAIGVNLYMVQAAYRSDPEGTLEALAKIGFREIETTLNPAQTPRFVAGLKRFGLKCSAAAVLPKPLGDLPGLQSDPGQLAEAVHALGAQYLVCTLFPLPPSVDLAAQAAGKSGGLLEAARNLTADDWKRTAEVLNERGAALRRHGVTFAYHNHNPEFAPHGETNGLAILLEHTEPQAVAFEMDAGWVVAAGHDPVEILRAYPGRFRLMHVKDIASTQQANLAFHADTTEVGSGVIDWKRVLAAARASGVRHYAVEQEPPYTRMPPFEAARKAYDFLSRLEA